MKNGRFYTPNIWVITTKNEGNVGSHGLKLVMNPMACHPQQNPRVGVTGRIGFLFAEKPKRKKSGIFRTTGMSMPIRSMGLVYSTAFG